MLVPYLEFHWANFFRDHLEEEYFGFKDTDRINSNSTLSGWCKRRVYDPQCYRVSQVVILEALLPAALKLSQSEEARVLPGFLPVNFTTFL